MILCGLPRLRRITWSGLKPPDEIMPDAACFTQATASTMNGLSSRRFCSRWVNVERPREHDPRTLWNAIQYVATTGCQCAIAEGIPTIHDGAAPFLQNARQRLT